MSEQFSGTVEIQDTSDDTNTKIVLDGETGNIDLGGHGAAGNLIVNNETGDETVRLDGDVGDIKLGGNGQAGNVSVKNDAGETTIRLNGGVGDIKLGGNGQAGNVLVRDDAGDETIRMNGAIGNIVLGGNGVDGDVVVKNAAGDETIRLDGESGDVVVSGADCAEDFDVLDSGLIDPGTVMVLDHGSTLRPGTQAYDKKVAGIVSGAGDCRPGIVLGRKASRNKSVPLALVGKVFCKVDAQYGSIEMGDLLTTSATPGYAMKASDPVRAFGAVIGKALGPAQEGTGLIPVLVALQ